MGYFDSTKNRALWEKELSDLEGERERRMTEGYKPKRPGTAGSRDSDAALRSGNNPKVRRINLKELEEIERQSRLAQGQPVKDKALRSGRQRSREAGSGERQAENLPMLGSMG